MSTLIAVLALVIALAAAVVAWRLQRANKTLRAETIGLLWRLEQADMSAPRGAYGELPPADRLLSIRILNPLELASAQTKVATMLHRVRPALLSKMVYEQAAESLRERLADEGVVAEVKVHADR
ncbi:hypothetical protein FB381_2287 [Nocardioides albertanoniae]|uniref:Uncharacterized protein n=1 Tax=Nocardioides albertanoniae TaxID=1175486 RepID=A0A543A743_9ACTN|nr:hypothetical protein [Nocardioides albertanoniae]TQL68398.1 hypothetical protein FB381_2287 [Nocardioides albertanoniae]